MSVFIPFPAIDLRRGQVVRLRGGAPGSETVFSSDPADCARRWIEAGARWLHVVNLDGAFGEDDDANRAALSGIVKTAAELGAAVQFGGGLRTEEAVRAALEAGVQRAVLGTSAVENPDMLAGVLERWGPERIAAGVDAREGVVYVRGWRTGSGFDPLSVARRLQDAGVRWVLYTDIARDGLNQGLNLSVAQSLASGTALNVVASGGVRSLSEVEEARAAGLAGVIVGRALYTGQMDPQALFALETPAC